MQRDEERCFFEQSIMCVSHLLAAILAIIAHGQKARLKTNKDFCLCAWLMTRSLAIINKADIISVFPSQLNKPSFRQIKDSKDRY